MFLVHKDIPSMPLSELENDSESVWPKIFANKTLPIMKRVGSGEEFQFFRYQLDT